MLISCPRCGLSQPNDQYCAQCGVDMQSFKQKKQPAYKRIINNAFVQIGILLLIAVLLGQFIFQKQEPQGWVQKLTPFQSQFKPNKTVSLSNSASEKTVTEQNSLEKNQDNSNTSYNVDSANNTNQNLPPSNQRRHFDDNPAFAPPPVLTTQNGNQDLSSITFKVTYAEISQDILAKWVSDSSELGLYQNLSEYSAGIIYDFKKYGDTFLQTLKTANIKLSTGNANSNLSGTMTNDGSQMLGLVAVIEYKSNENEIIHGNINITKSNSLGSESLPAEFSLPKGAIFFMIGAIKRDNFLQERNTLTMPPFQIFKSPDFMTRKTEFVIIVEPVYK